MWLRDPLWPVYISHQFETQNTVFVCSADLTLISQPSILSDTHQSVQCIPFLPLGTHLLCIAAL